MDSYIAAKARIFQNHGPTDTAVLNADCAPLAPLARSLEGRCRLAAFSVTRPVEEGAFLDGDKLILRSAVAGDAVVSTTEELGVPGLHNAENALAAACLAGSLGVAPDAMRPAFRAVRAGAHTLRALGQADGVLYVNDSKGTNVDATLRALASCPGPVVLIAGGSAKDANYAPLGPAIAAHCRAVVVIGDTGPEIARVASASGLAEVRSCESLAQAVAAARALARPGDTVLLSPASASFGLFQSYAHRGEVFEELVAAIPGFVSLTEEVGA